MEKVNVFRTTCREATMLLSRQQEEKLPKRSRWALAIHLLYCRSCRLFRNQLQKFTKDLFQLKNKQVLSQEKKQRLEELIENEL
jgi:hypothetical protein